MDLEFIRWVQSLHSPWLDSLMLWITKLGDEEFYLLAGPVIYWCFGTALGLRLLIPMLSSFYINDGLKDLVDSARPVAAYPDQVRVPEAVAASIREDEGQWESGFPSGHAQDAVVFWGFMARWWRRPAALVAAVVLIVLIGLSRIYLGVHWPVDVLGGWLIGLLLLAILVVVPPILARQSARRHEQLLLLAALLGFVLFLPDQELDRARILGFWSGALLSYALQQRYIPFRVHAPFWQQLAKILIGLVGVFALRYALKAALPATAWANWLRYAIMAAWVIAIAPLIFRALFGAGDRETATPVTQYGASANRRAAE